MKSEAVWIVEPEKVEIRTIEVPEPLYDEIQVETKAVGVCSWDAYLYRGMSAPGPLPYMIGHEAVGIVSKVGAGVKNFKPGDKVACASGSNEMMSQYFNVKHNCATRIPDDVEDYALWVLEPTVCVVNLLHKSQIEPGESVVLVGAGYMGLLALQGLVKSTPVGSITVFETRPERLEIAKSYGPEFCFDPYSEEGQAHIKKIQAEGGADIVIDFAASDSGYDLSCSLTSDQAGKFVLGTWHRKEKEFDGTRWHLSGVNVLNLAPGSNKHFIELIQPTAELIRRGVYNPGSLVTHKVNYRDAAKILAMSNDKPEDYIKGVVTF